MYLAKNHKLNKSYVSVKKDKYAKLSHLSYNWIGSYEHFHILEINPSTGRHHQIRVMLSHLGCPIAGDTKYGATKLDGTGTIYLHARRIKFMHPVKKEPIVIQAGLPNDPIWKYFRELV